MRACHAVTHAFPVALLPQRHPSTARPSHGTRGCTSTAHFQAARADHRPAHSATLPTTAPAAPFSRFDAALKSEVNLGPDGETAAVPAFFDAVKPFLDTEFLATGRANAARRGPDQHTKLKASL